MIYTIGTAREIPSLPCMLPRSVQRELLRCTMALDREYGEDRDYHQTGGYSVIVETDEDVSSIKPMLNIDAHFPEWVDKVDRYAAALYLLNDDFSVVLFVPLAIAPKTILNELEENAQ